MTVSEMEDESFISIFSIADSTAIFSVLLLSSLLPEPFKANIKITAIKAIKSNATTEIRPIIILLFPLETAVGVLGGGVGFE